jgi:putative hydrolase of the HAD superfamily
LSTNANKAYLGFRPDNTPAQRVAAYLPAYQPQHDRLPEEHLQLSEEEAGRLRVQYWRSYGATLLGMMRHHGTDPGISCAKRMRFQTCPT